MRNEMLVHHMHITIVETILFLFQMAILEVPVGSFSSDHNLLKTYVRSTINIEAAPTAV
jgi:hypothetical protein